MNYGEIKYCDIANGNGVRISLFVSGCTHHCPNCFNPETWDFNYGKPFTQKEWDEIFSQTKDYVNGLSLLGGEPFEVQNQGALLNLVKRVKATYPQKDIWCYTGYVFDTQLLSESRARCEHTDELLSYIDVLVDGPFVEEQKDADIEKGRVDRVEWVGGRGEYETGWWDKLGDQGWHVHTCACVLSHLGHVQLFATL